MKSLFRAAFWILAYLGRPFGGIRPHRLMHWIALRGYDAADAVSDSKFVVRTGGGLLRLHPFYHLDREVIITGYYDRPLHLFLARRLKPGMIVLDVGANIGEVAIHMAGLVGPGGRVYAFEPAPPILKRLRENVALNGMEEVVRVSDVALSSASRDGVPFSFAAPDVQNQGMGSLVNRKNEVVSRDIEIRTITLDDFMGSERPARIDLAKVDIQGGELAFLEGGAKTLAHYSPDLVLEISPVDLAAAGKRPSDLLRVLENLGYRTYSFGPGGPASGELHSATVDSAALSLNVYCRRELAAEDFRKS